MNLFITSLMEIALKENPMIDPKSHCLMSQNVLCIKICEKLDWSRYNSDQKEVMYKTIGKIVMSKFNENKQ